MTTKLSNDVAPKDAALTPPGILENARGRIYTPVNKDWGIFEKYGRETNGEYTLIKLGVMPGGENPPHWHGSYSETFTAEKGHLGVWSKSTGKMMLEPGKSFTVPAGEEHHFFNLGEEDVECQVRLTPAREGFEKALYILYGLARDGKCVGGGFPRNPMHMAVCFCMADMWPAGVGGALITPIIKAVAWIGKVIGTEKYLVQTYWMEDGERPKQL
ncbi:hypothetical protein K505DRAFT_371587 [Melanomma pulvis-pyrius CBS 109.77]|uniref:Cupin type-2 domain-containing protein n=1 Tax=Melanomma pulvis-pyrius CBS 109.77 TaxID=1314802 RepID=A0A6A6XQG3_9PLEO|nr:hypothetical protein K505DRAFT_371587 [Melanomma pulvis-pyrius CBS 109.77]